MSRRQAVAASLPSGHRAALTSVMLCGASLVFILGLFRVPVNEAGDPIATRPERVAEWSIAAVRTAAAEGADATADQVKHAVNDWSPGGKQAYIVAFWPLSLSIFLPLIGSVLGFRAVSRRGTAKIVNRAMYATLFGALLTTQLLIFFLPGVVAMGIAAFQVRKAEFAAAAVAAPDDDDVDDDEPADDDDVEDLADDAEYDAEYEDDAAP